MVYVTHDQEEAMTLGQRIAVLRDGALQQVASPSELYDRPANVFVAQFIGSPAMNLFTGAAAALFAPADTRTRVAAEGLTVGIRPHDMAVVAPGSGCAVGPVVLVEPLGHAAIARVEISGHGPVVVVVGPRPWPQVGELVALQPVAGRCHLFAPDGRRA